MYLIDTNVISELRKGDRADSGVVAFFAQAASGDARLFLSAITVGEIRRGIGLAAYRGDLAYAALLNAWLTEVLAAYDQRVLSLDSDAAQIWGRLRVPDPHPIIGAQIAAIAILHDLTVVTRNLADFRRFGLKLLNPFN